MNFWRRHKSNLLISSRLLRYGDKIWSKRMKFWFVDATRRYVLHFYTRFCTTRYRFAVYSSNEEDNLQFHHAFAIHNCLIQYPLPENLKQVARNLGNVQHSWKPQNKITPLNLVIEAPLLVISLPLTVKVAGLLLPRILSLPTLVT